VDPHLLDVLFVDDDVASLLELEPLDDVGVGHFALAFGAPALLLDARLALAVELVEAQGRAGISGGKHLDRNVDEADLQIAFPRRSRGHDAPLGRASSAPPARAEQAPTLLLDQNRLIGVDLK